MRQYIDAMLTAGVLLAATGCGTKQERTSDGLRDRLQQAVCEGGFFYAHQDDPVYGHSWKVTEPETDPLERSDVRAVCGLKPAMVGFDLGGIELGDAANLDGVDFNLMRRAAVKHWTEGGIVTFSWHARNPLTGGDSWDISSRDAVASVLEGGENHGKFMEWLGRAADFIDSLRDGDGNRIPAIFRPWHENIGSWFWWGGNLCTPEQYKALFALTHDYFEKERGLDNLLWAYSPNSEIDSTQYFSRYPGDELVDILGVDHYEFISPDPASENAMAEADAHFVGVLSGDLEYMKSFAAEHGKLVAVSETGFEGIPNPRWWTDVLLKAVEGQPVCYVLTWRNAWDKPGHFYAPFEGSADAEDFRSFCADDRTIFLEQE